MIFDILLSIFTGTILGSLYGLSVLLQKQRAHSQFKIIIFSLLRLFLIFFILYCLSTIQNINFILTVITFILIFWMVTLIIVKK